MDDALSWRRSKRGDETAQTQSDVGTNAGFGGEDEGPVLVGTVAGPVEVEMAEDALKEAGIPVLIKRNSLGSVYGLSVGSFGAAEVWVPQPLAGQAHDILVGIGVLGAEY